MAVAEVEVECEGTNAQDDECGGAGTGVWQIGGSGLHLLGERLLERDVDGITVNVVELEVVGVLVRDANWSVGDGVFNGNYEGLNEAVARLNDSGRPDHDTVREVAAGWVADGGVFEDVFEVLGDHIVGRFAAGVFGGKSVADLVSGLGGLGGGVDVLGEINGGLVLGEGGWYSVNGNGVAAGRGYGRGFATFAMYLEMSNEFTRVLIYVNHAASGVVP